MRIPIFEEEESLSIDEDFAEDMRPRDAVDINCLISDEIDQIDEDEIALYYYTCLW